jgi:hypothetical protein
MRLLLRALVAFVVLVVAQMISGALLMLHVSAPPRSNFAWFAASQVIAAALLTLLADRLACKGWQRVLVLLAAAWGIQANNLVEAGLFPFGLESGVLPRLFVITLLPAFAVCVTLDRVSGPAAPAPTGLPFIRTRAGWAAFFACSVLGYVVVYLAAGMLAWPHVRSFYEQGVMPPLPLVIFVQLFRGSFLVALLTLLASRLSLPRSWAAVAGGVTLSLLGGIVPLMAPNAFMPDAVRFAHLAEVGASNLLFGWLTVLALTRAGSRNAPRSEFGPEPSTSTTPKGPA